MLVVNNAIAITNTSMGTILFTNSTIMNKYFAITSTIMITTLLTSSSITITIIATTSTMIAVVEEVGSLTLVLMVMMVVATTRVLVNYHVCMSIFIVLISSKNEHF